MNRAFTMLLQGAPLVAMHRGLSWRTARGFELDTGAYVAALEAASGVKATVVGKPEAAFFEEARAALGLEADRVAMVGDDIENDVLAAQACGMHGILVRTGKFRPEWLADAPGAPDVVLDSFADVPGLVG
jgi:HAD superfamily hydrolase (TIGR01458 family)